jgi:CubicO group peptidase (beta-lactamase class C family)
VSGGGLVKPRLRRMHEVLSGHVERGEMPGLVALVSRGGDVHVEVLGRQSLHLPAPMRRDTIFRIASLTKPVTAAAAMILVEECRIRLDDAIDPWLPELADRRVLRSLASPLHDTVPAKRRITLRDLLTSRMGFGSVMAMPDTYPIQARIRDLRIGGDRPPLPTDAPPMDEWLRALGSLPLMAQPGERWMYHVSVDVLGALVARVTGQPLGAFMRERLFGPLGMDDTGFHVPAHKLSRLAGFYRFDDEAGALVPFDSEERSAWADEPAFQTGAGGLVSTVDDCFAFQRMLLNRGRHGDEQILSPATVALMTTDHVAPEERTGAEMFFGTSSSWAFGMAVDVRRGDIHRTPGRFGWDGGYGTSAYTDPAEGMIGILLTQRLVDSPEPTRVSTAFWTTAYGAIG